MNVSMGGKLVGRDQPLFVVIETGTTCNGKLDTALRMVDAAKEAGADAIKFQMIDPEYFMSDKTVTYEYDWAGGRRSENMFQMFQGLKFKPEEWARIFERCKEHGLVFYATVDYLPGVELAESLGVAAYKLSSWDARHYPLVERMARTKKPIQIDTGPVTLPELLKLTEVIRGAGGEQVILVHCSHSTNDAETNLRAIPLLERLLGFPVGYSADSRDFVPDIAAVALGARLVEKRLTLDRSYPGHHHVKALEPKELKEWIAMIRRIDPLLGKDEVAPSAEDLRQKKLYYVSIVADRDIPEGATITADMLACKRPGSGLSPELLSVIAGRRARRPIKQNELISWDAI